MISYVFSIAQIRTSLLLKYLLHPVCFSAQSSCSPARDLLPASLNMPKTYGSKDKVPGSRKSRAGADQARARERAAKSAGGADIRGAFASGSSAAALAPAPAPEMIAPVTGGSSDTGDVEAAVPPPLVSNDANDACDVEAGAEAGASVQEVTCYPNSVPASDASAEPVSDDPFAASARRATVASAISTSGDVPAFNRGGGPPPSAAVGAGTSPTATASVNGEDGAARSGIGGWKKSAFYFACGGFQACFSFSSSTTLSHLSCPVRGCGRRPGGIFTVSLCHPRVETRGRQPWTPAHVEGLFFFRLRRAFIQLFLNSFLSGLLGCTWAEPEAGWSFYCETLSPKDGNQGALPPGPPLLRRALFRLRRA